MTIRRALSVLFALLLLPATLAYANTAPAANREEVRKKLDAFFANVDPHAPAALTAISKSPTMLKAIDGQIASMSDADVAQFQKMMSEVPDWQKAPETMAKMLSPDAMKAIEKTSADFKKRAPEAEKTRSDISTLATVLKMLPDAKLKELGVTREMVGSLDGAMNQISPLQAGVLEQQLTRDPGWKAKSDAALAALPPALQKGAAALAKHGELTALDKVELEKFRSQLITLFGRVRNLPEATRKELKIEELGPEVAQLDRVTPEVLFMLREQMTPEAMQKMSESVDLMERVANLTDDDRKVLDHFRSGLEDVFARGEHAAESRQKIESMSAAELMVLKSGMPDLDAWKQTEGAYVTALSDPGLSQRISALQQPTPDPAMVASLEEYRARTLSVIDSASVDPKVAASAHDAVQKANLPTLEMMRTVESRTPNIAAEKLVKIATDIGTISLNCTLSLGSIHIPVIDVDISLGSIDFGFICSPIQTAINAIDGAINTAVDAVENSVTSVINDVQTFLNNAISSAKTFLQGLISAVTSTVNNIWSFIQTIPNLAWQAIQTAFNALLDLNLGGGLTIRTLIAGGISQVVPALQQALNLGEGFWNSLNGVLPQIPCPPAGFSTPFGSVGSDDAAAKYNHYAFFLDKIFGLIPSDVFSLEVKIPAQVLYAAWQYLGVCLNEAAQTADAAAASALADQRFTTITGDFTALGNQANGNTLSLINALNALSNLTSTDDANLTSLINSKTSDLKSNDNQKFEDARQLALRITIERDLQAGDPGALAMFQLPHANGGYLEDVRDIVNNDINGMLAAGQAIGQAQKFFSNGLTSFANGQFKDAFKNFQNAYSELTKH